MSNIVTEQKAVDRVKAQTKDIGLAAFYWCQPGAEIVDLNTLKKPGREVIIFTFVLPLTVKELGQLELDYANGKTLVEPKTFIAKQESLRDLLFTAKGTLKKINSGVQEDGPNKER